MTGALLPICSAIRSVLLGRTAGLPVVGPPARRLALQLCRVAVDPWGMAFQYHLRISSSDRTYGFSTYAEASRAIAASLTGDRESWELVRTNDGPDTWTDILFGAGPPNERTRFAEVRHYPPLP